MVAGVYLQEAELRQGSRDLRALVRNAGITNNNLIHLTTASDSRQTFKQPIPILLKPFKKERKNSSKLILQGQNYLDIKIKDTAKKESCRLSSLMNLLGKKSSTNASKTESNGMHENINLL